MMRTAALRHLASVGAVLRARSDLVAGLMVTMVVMMMIVPLPTFVLDVAIALNFATAVLLVALASFVPNPLAFSTFPIILLIATAFRLSISISTTRLVLLDADAGHIVEAFGNFVVRGNLVVGLVMFLIITIVQFLVVTKGAERIAEVSARFSLDALPGKQLSIDADLRAGFIDAREAKLRRTNLSRESQLFGAMDGTMKFVKGDAIAGLIIVAINLVGGVSVGVLQQGMSAGDALHRYSVLTIGDGLIAQIPALLIALSAGLLIARVGPQDDSEGTVSEEMSRQMLSEPRAWVFTATVLMLLAAVPGMPVAVFSALAMSSGIVGLSLQKKAGRVVASNAQLCEEGVKDLRTIEACTPLSLRINSKYSTDEAPQMLARLARKARNRLVMRNGLTLPNLMLEFSNEVGADELHLCIYETPQLRMTWAPGQVAWLLPRNLATTADVGELAAVSKVPRVGMREAGWNWMPSEKAQVARDAGCVVRSFEELFVERVRTTLLDAGHQFLGMQEMRAFVSWLDREAPELAKELQRTVATAKMCYLMQQLAKERVPVRNFRLIAEVIISNGLQERDPELVVDILRKTLRDDLLAHFVSEAKVPVCMVQPSLESALRSALRETQGGAQFDLPPGQLEDMLLQLTSFTYKEGAFEPSAVIVVPQDLRRAIWEVASRIKRHLAVISYQELSPSFEYNVLGHAQLRSVTR